MEIFIVWFVLALLVGLLASSRGRSGVGFFLISVVCSPLLGLIIVLVIRDLNKEAQETAKRNAENSEADSRRRQEHELQLASIKALAPTAQAAVPGTAQPFGVSTADEIEKLAGLLDRGLLTSEEFTAQKARILGAPAPAVRPPPATPAPAPKPFDGECPNCQAKMFMGSDKCPHCKATFGVGSTWKVRPLR